jgi:GTP1/Obg family GTP-binding protein
MRQKMDVLNAEVMEPFLTFMFENLQKLQEANEEVKKELEEIFTLMPDIKDLKQFLLPSIFRVMSDPTKAELIQMEYLS